MTEKSSNDEPHRFEDMYALSQHTNYPAYQVEHLIILKPNIRTNQQLSREIDSDGFFTTTIGSERFYQFAKVLHPAVTDPILCSELILHEDLGKLKSLINPKSISNGQLSWLHKQVDEELLEAQGALDLQIISEIQRHTYEAARILQFAIYYNQARKLITTHELFKSYDDTHLHKAWDNILHNQKNINSLRSIIEEIKDTNSHEQNMLSMLGRI